MAWNRKWAHINLLKTMLIDEHDRTAATQQMHATVEEAALPEYEVEAVLDMRGKKKDNTREFLIRWVGYDVPTWEPEDELNNPQLIKQFTSRKSAAQQPPTKQGSRRSARLNKVAAIANKPASQSAQHLHVQADMYQLHFRSTVLCRTCMMVYSQQHMCRQGVAFV